MASDGGSDSASFLHYALLLNGTTAAFVVIAVVLSVLIVWEPRDDSGKKNPSTTCCFIWMLSFIAITSTICGLLTKQLYGSLVALEALQFADQVKYGLSNPPNTGNGVEWWNATDCYDLLHLHGQNVSGVYTIYPPGIEPFQVWCDMDTDGGGWTLFQRREDGKLSFWNMLWIDYKLGFNDGTAKNFWLGLDRIHVLSTKDRSVTMRMDLDGNRCPDFECENLVCEYTTTYSFTPFGKRFGEWDNFEVEDEKNNYRVHFAQSTKGDWFFYTWGDLLYTFSNNMSFTTIDRDNDQRETEPKNCAELNHNGGWWHNNCGAFRLNGLYDGLTWFGFGIHTVVNPVRSELKLRKVV